MAHLVRTETLLRCGLRAPRKRKRNPPAAAAGVKPASRFLPMVTTTAPTLRSLLSSCASSFSWNRLDCRQIGDPTGCGGSYPRIMCLPIPHLSRHHCSFASIWMSLGGNGLPCAITSARNRDI